MKADFWKKWAAVFLCISLGCVFVFFFMRYLLPLFLPFVFAWMISFAVVPLAKWASDHLHISYRFCAATVLLLFLALFGTLIYFAANALIAELRDLFGRVLQNGGLESTVNGWMAQTDAFLERIRILPHGDAGTDADGFREQLHGLISRFLTGIISSFSAKLPTVAGNILSFLPSVLFGAAVTVISGFYFCVDREYLGKAVYSILPKAVKQKIPAWKAGVRRLSWRYVRAYLLFLLLTFFELLVGFLILRVRYALLLAMIIAVVDMLPVLGVGTVLVPWSVVMLFQRNYYVGFGLLILYAAVLVLHQIWEPKLVGHSLGLHPILTLFAGYAGWRLFGVLGMILAPIAVLPLKMLLAQRKNGGSESTESS